MTTDEQFMAPFYRVRDVPGTFYKRKPWLLEEPDNNWYQPVKKTWISFDGTTLSSILNSVPAAVAALTRVTAQPTLSGGANVILHYWEKVDPVLGPFETS